MIMKPLKKSSKKVYCKSFMTKTHIKKFYLTGQDVITVGVGGALFSGVITSMALLKKDVFRRILNYEVPAETE